MWLEAELIFSFSMVVLSEWFYIVLSFKFSYKKMFGPSKYPDYIKILWIRFNNQIFTHEIISVCNSLL